MANTDFTLPRDAYISFDALTLKSLIKRRLDEGGIFTDQNFEGSNLSALIDIIALSYHLSIFYLNQTSTEALFDQASIYENINRITKLIGYKPTGYKTSLLSFEATANSNLSQGIYTIKRFSYFNVNGILYSFANDITFSKTNNSVELLSDLSNNNLLFQGKFFEYPEQTALGEDFETKTLLVRDNITNQPIFIEDSSIQVFVKPANSNNYVEYTEIDSIFNADSSTFAFEKRINENGYYELKFGNGVFGSKLEARDKIYIYYLRSDGTAGRISANTLNGNNLNAFTTTRFEDISLSIYDQDTLFLTPVLAQNISFTNPNGSTNPSGAETVEEIKQNAPKTFYSQNRIVTRNDLTTFLQKNYSNIVASQYVASNNEYIDTYIKYFYDLGLDRPNSDSRFLYNQVKFSTSNQANNVYVYLIPKIQTVDSSNNLYFLSQAQKSEILNGIDRLKMLNMEIVPQDPVYNAITVGLPESNISTPSIDDIDNTFIVIERRVSNRISVDRIRELVNNIFINNFNKENATLGQVVDIGGISGNILNIEGVQNIKTRRVVNGQTIYEVPFLNLYSFNPIYPDNDLISISTNFTLPFFKYPFLFNGSISDKIIIETL